MVFMVVVNSLTCRTYLSSKSRLCFCYLKRDRGAIISTSCVINVSVFDLISCHHLASLTLMAELQNVCSCVGANTFVSLSPSWFFCNLPDVHVVQESHENCLPYALRRAFYICL